MDHSKMDHSNMSAEMMAMMMGEGIEHADTEYGPHIDMLAENPQYRLDDPGVGLRDNGRRVLTYADLKTLFPDPDGRDPGREIELHLTGNGLFFEVPDIDPSVVTQLVEVWLDKYVECQSHRR